MIQHEPMPAQTTEQDPFVEGIIQNCKKCSLPIYEGHAYELGDDRWHINCFKCSKCSSSLGCNSNFLVLGNGSLICSNCSYNCKQCGKKIDDLAILTGDQAYCSSCFKCRACKKKIEDLRYARTSKGLFCMNCHEKLMAKKRKYDIKKRRDRERPDPSDGTSEFGRSTPDLSASTGNKSEDERPLYQTKPSLSSIQSQSDLYDLYDRSSSPTPNLTAKNSSLLELAHEISRPESVMSKDKDLPRPPEERQKIKTPPPPQSQAYQSHIKPPTPKVHHPSPEKPAIDREFSIEEINDSDDELNARATPSTPNRLEPAVDLNSTRHVPLESPSGISHTKFQGKNLLILSPHQNLDAPSLRSPKSPDSIKTGLYVEHDSIKSRSNCPSPMARSNRHARVLDDNDNYNDNDDTIGLDDQKLDIDFHDVPDTEAGDDILPEPLAEVATPKRKQQTNNSTFSSPPPKIPLPSVPSVPSTPGGAASKHSEISDNYYIDKVINNEDTLNGLGLEGVEYNEFNDMVKKKTAKSMGNPAPAVTNLEEGTPSSVGRKSSIIKTPRLGLRHKRSTSGGNSSVSKLNIFKSREDKGHSRQVSDGSIASQNSYSAYVTPPLPPSFHKRSGSETNYTLNKMFESENAQIEVLKTEVHLLEVKKVSLLGDVKSLRTDKLRLQEEIESLRAIYVEEKNRLKSLSQEVTDLRSHKNELETKSASSFEDQVSSNLITKEISNSVVIDHRSNSSSSLVTPTPDSVIGEDNIETQKATKLKFWRRAKIGFNNGANLVVPSSNGNPVPASKDDEEVKKSGFALMTKSRSTNLLDSFLNNNNSPSLSNENGQHTDSENLLLFNCSIEARAKYENAEVPLIITRCIQEVEQRGLDLEGIYRISGGNSQILAIEQAFTNVNPKSKDDKSMTKLNETLDCDINAITSALKRYLRKIPDPLIPFKNYDEFIKLNSIPSEAKKIQELRSKIIDNLPSANREVLRLLCKHLELVNLYSSVNRMNYKNLSVVFAPTIARDETGEREMIDMGSRNDLAEFLLSNHAKIFE